MLIVKGHAYRKILFFWFRNKFRSNKFRSWLS